MNNRRGVFGRVLLLLMVSLLLCALAACNSGSNVPVGKWYNSKGKCLDIRDDGSWKLEGSYGTGTWKKLSDGIFEFTDFYGDTQESAINQDEYGNFIDFGYYGDFYKNEYPSKETLSQSAESQNQAVETTPTEAAVIELDPFENLTYEVSGISPYCKVAINNSKCSVEVQKYVTYTMDKELYANNEEIVITAHLSSNTGNMNYRLLESDAKYVVSGQSEYLTSLDNDAISFIRNELEDYITSRQANDTGGQFLFGYKAVFISTIESVTSENLAYFAALKRIKYDQYKSMDYFNSYTNIYRVSYTTRNDDSYTFYVAVAANNIVRTADGSIKWGNETFNYDFTCESNDKSLEDCITVTVMDDSQNYNITKVEQSDLQQEQSSNTTEMNQQGATDSNNATNQTDLSQSDKMTIKWPTTIDNKDVTIRAGESFSLHFTDESGQQIDTVWTSADTAMAAVSEDTVTGISKGMTIIWTDHDGKRYSCIVRIV